MLWNGPLYFITNTYILLYYKKQTNIQIMWEYFNLKICVYNDRQQNWMNWNKRKWNTTKKTCYHHRLVFEFRHFTECPFGILRWGVINSCLGRRSNIWTGLRLRWTMITTGVMKLSREEFKENKSLDNRMKWRLYYHTCQQRLQIMLWCSVIPLLPRCSACWVLCFWMLLAHHMNRFTPWCLLGFQSFF
jgi:hypothetical protein